MSTNSLATGGSVGSQRGKFYEFYLNSILSQKNYQVDESQKVIKDDSYYFRYRVLPDKITEIDLYFPTKRVGFWITNLGQVEKHRCVRCGTKKYNEFRMISGSCPHCNTGSLPDNTKTDYSRWICPNCKSIVDPFDLQNKQCQCGSGDFEKYTDTSASSQAHKQAYYRIGEYLEVKTSPNSNILCSEIIFNKKTEWRVWAQVLEKFFDSS
ncbi:MAG: hypothetical protein FJ356_06410, partial [Thaumarchaeota archaeon]|nr:hypothetical protein [Nitrososphaerota archaeon]